MEGPSPVSRRARLLIIYGALLLPLLMIGSGALIAHAADKPALNGAFAGCLATFVLVGSAWIALGVLGGRHELRLRAEGANEGPRGPHE